MGNVSIIKTGKDLKQSLHEAIELIGGLKYFVRKEDYVLLKPNLNDFDCITNPQLMEALIQYLFDFDVKRLMIGESTFGNQSITEKHFRKSGYYEICEKYNVPLINLNKSESVRINVAYPLILEKINLAKEVCEVTKIINIPVMKVHYATGVTLGLKNLKGFLTPDEKKHFHETGLDKAIADLGNTIPVDLTIIDGIECMERMGPKGGDVFQLGLLLAGENIAETDYIACQIMGYELHEVKHLQYFIAANGIETAGISVCGEKLDSVIRRFKKVKLEEIVPEKVTIHNAGACSACMNALLLSFRVMNEQIKTDTSICMGSKIKVSAQANTTIVAFGNCCRDIDADVKIKGCPPYPLLLRELL